MSYSSCSCCHNHDKLQCYSPYAQVIIAFFIGILFAPWSYGYIFLFAGILLFELIWIFKVHGFNDYLSHIERPLAIAASLLGWVLGRLAIKSTINESGHSTIMDWIKKYNKK